MVMGKKPYSSRSTGPACGRLLPYRSDSTQRHAERAPAPTGVTRDPRLLNVSTTAEAELTFFTLDSWVGMLVPPGLPTSVVGRLGRAANAARADPVSGSTAAMTTAIRRDMTLYGRVAKEPQIKAQP